MDDPTVWNSPCFQKQEEENILNILEEMEKS